MKTSSFTQMQIFWLCLQYQRYSYIFYIPLIKMAFSPFPLKLTLKSWEQNMTISSMIQYGKEDAKGGMRKQEWSEALKYRVEWTVTVERKKKKKKEKQPTKTEESVHMKKWGFKK